MLDVESNRNRHVRHLRHQLISLLNCAPAATSATTCRTTSAEFRYFQYNLRTHHRTSTTPLFPIVFTMLTFQVVGNSTFHAHNFFTGNCRHAKSLIHPSLDCGPLAPPRLACITCPALALSLMSCLASQALSLRLVLAHAIGTLADPPSRPPRADGAEIARLLLWEGALKGGTTLSHQGTPFWRSSCVYRC